MIQIEQREVPFGMRTYHLPKGTVLPARILGTLEIVKVNRVKDATYGYCLDCNQILEPGPTKAWTFRSTQWLHEHGTGHKTVMVAVRPIGASNA